MEWQSAAVRVVLEADTQSYNQGTLTACVWFPRNIYTADSLLTSHRTIFANGRISDANKQLLNNTGAVPDAAKNVKKVVGDEMNASVGRL